MFDIQALSVGAKEIHQIFESLFYGLITLFLLLGVITEYFKFPLGGSPAFGTLVGRALIATLLLATYPEVSNLIADLSDGIASKLGDLNKCKLVLTEMSRKLGEYSGFWVSIKDAVLLIISFITFFLLYASVYVVEALLLYTWIVLYAFSPLLIALFVLPITSRATSALYRSLIEISCWKIVWSAMATLVWSAALSDINKPGADISFLTAILYNLFLAASMVMTPVVVHALAGQGMSGIAQAFSSMATQAILFSPSQIVGAAGIPKKFLMKNAGKAYSAAKFAITKKPPTKNEIGKVTKPTAKSKSLKLP